MACKPITFTGISRDHFLAIRARIRAQADVEIAGDCGTATGNGFTAQWSYSEPNQSLEIQCMSKPFFISEGIVAGKIRDLVNGL